MRFASLLASVSLVVAATVEKFEYQSDVARLMKVVVQHLYNDRDVFVRELLSNSNDALEKTRLNSLTDPTLLELAPILNITVLADKVNNRIVIRDTGIGMSKKQLVENLGTIARSGTSEFLAGLEKEGEGDNLIGQFGLGFYSSFLVADRVTVASKSNDEIEQYMFESNSDAEGFSITEDSRGNTLGRGTEITLYLKENALEYLELERLKPLIQKHSEYGASPIYLWNEIIPLTPVELESEDVSDPIEVIEEEKIEGEWKLVNDVAPLWMRDPKEVSDEEYTSFYQATYKSETPPTSWTHFKGDAGSTSFRALIYLPSEMPSDFYSKSYITLQSLKLFVRRVFITEDLGESYVPKWLNWIKILVDADNLPLNVGRDSLQKSGALKIIKKNLIKRVLELFAVLAKTDPIKYNTLYSKVGVSLKLGAVEDTKNRARIVKLLRFETSASKNLTSLDDVVSRRKQGQNQIFFIASIGQTKKEMEKSAFVERLLVRGYEVLYFGEPMDEMIVSAVGSFEKMQFQDVAKKGLKFGDEDEELAEEELALKETFTPLSNYLKKELSESINEVVISTRLTTSPCLIVSDSYAWTGNMARLMESQNSGSSEGKMNEFMKNTKRTFEINPNHPLIEGLLEKVIEVEGEDEIVELELKETIAVLFQTALVKSGFNVADPNLYFSQVESLLRRSLGISKNAIVKDLDSIKLAPPIDDSILFDSNKEEADVPSFEGNEWANWKDMKAGLNEKLKVEENVEEQVVVDKVEEIIDKVEVGHDEL